MYTCTVAVYQRLAYCVLELAALAYNTTTVEENF